MELQIALILSAVLQFIAFFMTIRLIPRTKFNIAWISISLGFLLMALRRGIDVYTSFSFPPGDLVNTVNGWLAVIISVCMLISSFYIRKIFDMFGQIQKMRRENEARLLSSVIATEERERKNFAREIHDGLGPILSSMKMTLSSIGRQEDDPLRTGLLTQAEHLADNAIRATSEISNRMTPHIIERFGIRKAMENFIRNIPASEQVQIDFNTNISKERFDGHTEVIIYRICGELINNSLKHAGATRISILLNHNADNLDLKYDDDGVGFNPDTPENRGMGIPNIKSRVASLNGTIDIHSSPNHGFYAHINIPL